MRKPRVKRTKEQLQLALLEKVEKINKLFNHGGTEWDRLLQSEYHKYASLELDKLYTLQLRTAWKKASDNALKLYLQGLRDKGVLIDGI